MTELRKALERPVAGLVFDENRKNAVREKAFTAKRGGSALRRGTADGMVAGTAVGMIPGFTARPAIGATVRPSVSAGVGVVSMPATGARLGVGVRVIGDPVIGVVATGDIITIIMFHRIDIII